MEKYVDQEKLKKVIIYTFIFGIIAHGFMYFNAAFTHDSLYGIVGIPEIDEMNISIGRFMIPLYLKVRGYVASPALIGFLGLAFISFSSYLIIDLLGIKNKVSIIIICGILVVNYSVTVTNATYINDSDPYYLSLLLSVLGLYLIKKLGNRFKWLGILPLIVCIGLYQAYFQVPVFLLMIVALLQIVKGENTREVIKENLIIIAYLFASVVVYYIMYKASLAITGIAVGKGYNAIPELSKYFEIDTIVSYFRYMLSVEKSWLLGKNHHHAQLVFIVNVLFSIMAITSVVCLSKKNKISKSSIVLLIVIILLMPIGINFIGFLSEMYEHEVMTYSFFLFYPLAFILLEEANNVVNKKIIFNIGGIITLLCSLFLLLSSITYSNEMYLEKELIVTSTNSLMTRVIDRMEQTEGYELGKTPVVFIGSPVSSKYNFYRSGFLNTAEATNVYHSITYYQTYETYFNEYLGYPINLLTIVDEYNYAELEEVKAMPNFPAKGSVAFVGDTLVVKFCWNEN